MLLFREKGTTEACLRCIIYCNVEEPLVDLGCFEPLQTGWCLFTRSTVNTLPSIIEQHFVSVDVRRTSVNDKFPVYIDNIINQKTIQYLKCLRTQNVKLGRNTCRIQGYFYQNQLVSFQEFRKHVQFL